MDPQLSTIIGELQSAEQRLRMLRSILSHDSWTRRPGMAQWSAVECIAHLNLTSEALLPIVRAGLQEASGGVRRGASRYRRDLVGWLIWKAVAPSGRLRTRTVPAFIPSGERPPEAVFADFERLQAEVIASVRAADGLPIDRVKLMSPFHSRVTYNIYSALTMVPRHQHRHLLQAERAAVLPLHASLPAASRVAAAG